MSAIELSNVTKEYSPLFGSSVRAVENVDLQVDIGEAYGFLGPNGAGKSTLINVLLDFIQPTAGRATIFGLDCQSEQLAIRERIGVLPEGFSVYERLTGRQHVEFACRSKGVDDDPDALLERVGIEDAADRKAGGYSKGMAQRLALAMALVGEPDLLILDEPTSGLDPNGAARMRRIISEELDRGATVFFSSHILEQVEAVCDRVAIIDEGTIVAEDSIAALRESVDVSSTLRVSVDALGPALVDCVQSIDGVSHATSDEGELVVACDDGMRTTVLDAIEAEGVTVTNFSTEEASLEQLFAEYTMEVPA